MPRVFLDHLTATPLAPEVFEAMKPYLLDNPAVPSSHYQEGKAVRDAMEHARRQVAEFIGADSEEEIIFTSSGTEAANLAIKGVAAANRGIGDHIVVSAAEHPAVLNSVAHLEASGFRVSTVPVDSMGFVVPESVSDAIGSGTILVCVQSANPDIGTIQPLGEIVERLNDRGIACFSDAVASAGWMPIDVRQLGVNLLSFSPSRIYGPKGVGVLYCRKRTRLHAMLHGGDQEGGRRAGSENVPAIVGAGAAAALARKDLNERISHVSHLQERLWHGLHSKIEFLRLNGPAIGTDRLPHHLNLSVEFVEGEGLMLLADMRGLAIHAGSSCLSRSLQPAHVLEAIGLSPELARSSVILSLGIDNREEELTGVIAILSSITERLRSMSPTWDEFQRGLVPSEIAG